MQAMARATFKFTQIMKKGHTNLATSNTVKEIKATARRRKNPIAVKYAAPASVSAVAQGAVNSAWNAVESVSSS